MSTTTTQAVAPPISTEEAIARLADCIKAVMREHGSGLGLTPEQMTAALQRAAQNPFNYTYDPVSLVTAPSSKTQRIAAAVEYDLDAVSVKRPYFEPQMRTRAQANICGIHCPTSAWASVSGMRRPSGTLEFIVADDTEGHAARYTQVQVVERGSAEVLVKGTLKDVAHDYVYNKVRDGVSVVGLLNQNFPDCSALALALPVDGLRGKMTIVLSLPRDTVTHALRAIAEDGHALRAILDVVHPDLAAQVKADFFEDRQKVKVFEIGTLPAAADGRRTA